MNTQSDYFPCSLLVAIYAIISFFNIYYNPNTGTWNDLSRIATVQSLVEHRTLSIDQSTFLQFTGDKILVDGHFYSDKPPLLSILMSWVYLPLYHIFGFTLKDNYFLCCIAIMFVFNWLPSILILQLYLALLKQFNFCARTKFFCYLAFAYGNLYFSYVSVVNNHCPGAWSLFLAFYFLFSLPKIKFVFCAGFFAGLASCFDHSAIFIAFVWGLYLIYKYSFKSNIVWCYAFAASIPIAIHLSLNYSVVKDFLPLAMHYEYFNWPGSTFDKNNMTGTSFKFTNLWNVIYTIYVIAFSETGYISLFPIVVFAIIGCLFNKRHLSFFNFTILGIVITVLYHLCFNRFENYRSAYGVRWLIIFTPILYLFLPMFVSQLSYKDLPITKYANPYLQINLNYILILFLIISMFFGFVGIKDPWTRFVSKIILLDFIFSDKIPTYQFLFFITEIASLTLLSYLYLQGKIKADNIRKWAIVFILLFLVPTTSFFLREKAVIINGNFAHGLIAYGWKVKGYNSFAVYYNPKNRSHSATSQGVLKSGTISQSFAVPKNAKYLTFYLYGGNYPGATCINLFEGKKLIYTETGGHTLKRKKVQWDLKPYRQKIVTLELRDSIKEDRFWGFIAASNFKVD